MKRMTDKWVILEPIQCADCEMCLDKSQLLQHYKEKHL